MIVYLYRKKHSFFIVLQLQLSHLFTHCFPLSHPPPDSHSQDHEASIVFLGLSIPLLSPVIHLPSLVTVCLFFISKSLVLFCSFFVLLSRFHFCWLSSTYRWDHMVFVFHCLAYFTSTLFSSSIHAVVKG